MKSFHYTSNIVHGTPWMIEPQAHAMIAALLQRHIDGAEIAQVAPASNPMIQRIGATDVIRIHGPILPRAGLMGNISGAAGSAEIIQAIGEAAMSDSQSIVLDIDSPGGSVLQGFECADAILAACEVKEVVACVSGLGCSLAYLLASQADSIIASRASILGSIGVISTIQNDSRAEKNAGVDSITVASSRNKAMSGLSEDEMRAQMSAEVEMYFGMMKDAINRKRPGLVHDAESFPGTMLAPAALEAGLIDDIGSLEDVIRTLQMNAGK